MIPTGVSYCPGSYCPGLSKEVGFSSKEVGFSSNEKTNDSEDQVNTEGILDVTD